MNLFNKLVWVRGAGELGSAVAFSLYKSGFSVILSEIHPPLAIRRTVTFSDAVIDGKSTVEGITAKKIELIDFEENVPRTIIPLILDNPKTIIEISPDILIDARMIKSYDKDYRSWGPYVIGLGPGFSANQNCHTVIETMRGHDLGKILTEGEPRKNTGTPGVIGGETKRRVIYAPKTGNLKWITNFGDIVEGGQILGTINSSTKILSPLAGIIRGLIHPLVPVEKGLKIADVDPRGNTVNFYTLSDKARSIGRAALEVVMIFVKNSA